MGDVKGVRQIVQKLTGKAKEVRFSLINKLMGMALITIILCSIASLTGIQTMFTLKKSVDGLGARAIPSVILLGDMESTINLMDRNTVFQAFISSRGQAGTEAASADGNGQQGNAGKNPEQVPPASNGETPDNAGGASIKAASSSDDTKQTILDNIHHIDSLVQQYEEKYLDEADRQAFERFVQTWKTYRENVKFISGLSTDPPQSGDSQDTGSLYAATLEGISRLRSSNEAKAEAMVNKSVEQQDAGRSTAIIATIVNVVLSLCGTYFVARSITKPLSRIVSQVKTVTNGNLQVEPLAVKNRDEIGELAADFNEMCGSLRKLMSTVVDSSLLVSSTSEQLNASAEQTAEATEQIAVRAAELAQGAGAQLAQVSEATATVMTVSGRITGITDSFNHVAALISETRDKARAGNEVITATVSQFRNVQDKVSESSQSVTALVRKSEEIRAITSMIQDISMQTNLLSLNAAIEAARAGEQGRGFSVVAGEVQKLAGQSEEAAKKISLLVRDIMTSTGQVMLTMNDTVDALSAGMASAEHAGRSFSDIVESVEEVGEEAAKAVGEADAVRSDASSMASSMNEIAKIAEHAHESTETVAAVVEETMASMQEVSAGSNLLSKMAEGLNEAVSIFKV